MSDRKETEQELVSFIENWPDTADRNKESFCHFREYLHKKSGVSLSFIPRPGVTYSLRARHSGQKKKELFVMVDVIEDSPRWLSICFYAQMINDPEQRGDFVLGGLLGEDALCFDLEQWDEEIIGYIDARLDEACEKAARE